MNNYQTIEAEGKKLELWYDECPMNPREDIENLGTIISWTSRYEVGDEQYYSMREFLEQMNDDLTCEYLYDASDLSLFKRIEKNHVILPIYMINHSDISIRTISFNDRWDSGLIGFIFASKEKIRKTFRVNRISQKKLEATKRFLNEEIQVYDAYLRGEVFGFTLSEGNEIIDEVSGFYGDNFTDNGMIDVIGMSNIEVPNEFINELNR